MVGIAEVSVAFSSLQTAKDLIQGLNAAKTDAAVTRIQIELGTIILQAQQGLFAAQQAEAAAAQKIGQLEAEIVRLKDWTAERERYELVTISTGAFAYMEKPGMRSGQPPHWLCANCFENGKKSILQRQSKDRTPYVDWTCAACRATLSMRYNALPTYAAPEA